MCLLQKTGLFFLVLVLCMGSATAEQTVSAAATETPLPVLKPWLPQAPAADSEWDWLQLTSGEWLKGEIRGLERDVLEFDSDNLGILQLDWEDIQQLLSAKPMAVLYGESQTVIGYLITEDNQLVVLGPGVKMPFEDVIGIAKGTPNESDLWTGNVSLTLNFRTGNVEQQDFNSSLSLRRRTAQTSLRLDYLGNFSSYNSVENTNDHRASSTYDFRLDKDWFFRPVSIEFYRDQFQNIDYQWTVGAGVGYYVLENSTISWIVTAGPGYQITRYSSTEPENDSSPDSAIAFFSTQYEHDLTNSIDISASYQVIVGNEAVGRAKHHAQCGLNVDLTARLDLTVTVYWDRIESPQADDEGVEPEQDDAQLAVGLNLEF